MKTEPLSCPAKPPHLRITKPWRLRLDLLPELLACTQDFLLIHCRKPVVIDNGLPVANYSAGAPPRGIENEIADEGETRGGDPFVASQIPQDEICLFAHLDAANFILKLQCPWSVDSRHVKRDRFRCPGRNLE